MKIFLSSLALILACSLLNAQTSIAVGSSAPLTDVKMQDVSGKNISIKDAIDANGVLVMFSCNTCPYVIKNQTRTKEIISYAKQNKVGVVIINSNEAYRNGDDSFADMKAYAKDQGYTIPYLLDVDSKVANAFGATRTPEIFLLDANGKLIYKGAIDDNPADAGNVKRVHLKLAIDETIGGKPITIKESKSVGCSIKRKS